MADLAASPRAGFDDDATAAWAREQPRSVAKHDSPEDEEFRRLAAEGSRRDRLAYEERLKEAIGSASAAPSGNCRRSFDGARLAAAGREELGEENVEDEVFVYTGRDMDAKQLFGEDEAEGDYAAQLDAILGSAREPSDPGGVFDGHKPGEGVTVRVDAPSSFVLSPHTSPVNGKGRPGTLSPVYSSNTSTPSTSFSQTQNVPPHTPTLSVLDSTTSGAPHSHLHPRRPFNPRFSRLRSSGGKGIPSRSASASTLGSNMMLPGDLRRASGSPTSDAISRQSSFSNICELPGALGNSKTPSIAADSEAELGAGIFRWSSLRRISNKIYPDSPVGKRGHQKKGPTAANNLLGPPTVVAASGVIAIGTGKGWAMVFDYALNLKCVLATEAIAKEAGAVTSLAISHDHTYIGVGHASGHIYLYDLAKPSAPARAVLPTTLAVVQNGRKEGHLTGSKIIHLGFVGVRHTAIVSADDTGLAFYHSLGKMFGLASTDVVRILGRYPEGPPPRLDNIGHNRQLSEISTASGHSFVNGVRPRKPTTVFGAAPLPLGPSPHLTDGHSLAALLTPSKLIIVGLKPTPRTWWRITREMDSDRLAQAAQTGALCWFPSSVVKDTAELRGNVNGIGDTKKGSAVSATGMDPILAFAWGSMVQFVTVLADGIQRGGEGTEQAGVKAGKAVSLRFVEGKSWKCEAPVVAVQWLSWRILCILTATHFEVVDTQIWQRTGWDPVDFRSVVRLNVFKESHPPPQGVNESQFDAPASAVGSMRAYKGKVFLLTTHDLRLGVVTSWADRILLLVESGALVEAIELTVLYWHGRAEAETIGLPSENAARQALVGPKLREIMTASLDYVFSEDRMHDDTHHDPEGRGVDRTALFEGLVTACVKACLAIDGLDFVFEDVYERYSENGIRGMFLGQLEPFILNSIIKSPPTSIVQSLIELHEERQEFDLAERIIWHVDPLCLDVNQALGLCQRQNLFDALIFVYTHALGDFVGPIAELLRLFRRIQHHRKQRPQRIDGDDDAASFAVTVRDNQIEKLVPDAYKLYTYLSTTLSGLAFPGREPHPLETALQAREAVSAFIFSGRSINWPQPSGPLVLTEEDGQPEPAFPYIRLMLRFDTEATLDALDVALEDSFFDDATPSRQTIVDLLLDVFAGSSDFTSTDRTFMHIFIARNLPKYPQFLSLPASTLHQILVGLASDSDQSTREDRQLAAEFLLSGYSPVNPERLVQLFEDAGFWRLARTLHRQQRNWPSLVRGYLSDPDCDADVFRHLTFVLLSASKCPEESHTSVWDSLLESVPQLVGYGVRATAYMIERFRPAAHGIAVAKLASFPNRQFAYLRCLLEPDLVNDAEEMEVPRLTSIPSLDPGARLQYLSLMCEYDPKHVLDFLQIYGHSNEDQEGILRVCEESEAYDAVIWHLDRIGTTRAALDRVDELFETRCDLIVTASLDGVSASPQPLKPEWSSVSRYLDQIAAAVNIATKVCMARSSEPQDGVDGEDAWLRLLSALIDSIQTCAALLPSPNNDAVFGGRAESDFTTALDVSRLEPARRPVPEVLRSLLPPVLASLISSTTSTHLSFPRLIRSLLDRKKPSVSNTNRSTAELRAVVTTIMDTYQFEGQMLGLTCRLLDRDQFEDVAALQRGKQCGWRPDARGCEHCGKAVWGPLAPSAAETEVPTIEKLGLPQRPILARKKSLKGKEVDLDDAAAHLPPRPTPWQAGPRDVRHTDWARVTSRGIAVMRDGTCYHRSCWESVARLAIGA